MINSNLKKKNGFIHLYNPKKEGLGSYDIHYINAYKKNIRYRYNKNLKTNERKVA